MPIVPLNTVGYESIPKSYPEMRKILDTYNENFRWIEMLLNQGTLDQANLSASFVVAQNVANFFNFRIPGNYYTNMLTAGRLTSSPAQINRLFAIPFPVPTTQNFDRIALNVSEAAAGMCRLGIYADNGRIYPGTLVSDVGEVNTGVAGMREITVTLALNAGFYWLVCLFNTMPSVSGVPIASMIHFGYRIENINSDPQVGWQVLSFPYGGLPGSFPINATSVSGVIPAVFLRKAV